MVKTNPQIGLFKGMVMSHATHEQKLAALTVAVVVGLELEEGGTACLE